MAADILIITGSIFIVISTIGLIRLPDPLSRIHSISKITSFGLGLMIIATILEHYEFGLLIKSILVLFFLILTTPLSAHVIARNITRHKQK
ncbi:MAG: sodium:proton antiporter [Bacteroidetes bacterium]|jgi:multicomponent Na+:H+ antiporter subunit G|nr:sodium:proton antiporter [Bacteroidota bacterium]